MILCGGKGARLKPLTDSLPKPLIPLNGRPCLQHILQSYIRKGHRDFVLCIGYRGDLIVDFVQKTGFDAEIEFSDAGEEAGILERLHLARSQIGERCFVAYGDTLIDVNLKEMLRDHQDSGAEITLTTAEVMSPFGLVTLDPRNWILSFEEKPKQPYYVGHMLMERTVLDTLDPELLEMGDGSGLVRLFQEKISERRVRTYPYRGPQITFNTEQDLDNAQRELMRFYTQMERGP